MQTAIRIIEQQYNGSEYRHYFLQILTKRMYSDNFEPAGLIKWQQDKKHEAEGREWYAKQFVIETDSIKHIKLMAKVAQLIDENCSYDAQPNEVFKVLGGVEYFHSDFDFIAKSKIGESFYKVMKNAEYYSSIIAPNEIVANKLLAKKKLTGEVKLVFSHVVAG